MIKYINKLFTSYCTVYNAYTTHTWHRDSVLIHVTLGRAMPSKISPWPPKVSLGSSSSIDLKVTVMEESHSKLTENYKYLMSTLFSAMRVVHTRLTNENILSMSTFIGVNLAPIKRRDKPISRR